MAEAKHYDIVALSVICVDIRIESTDKALEKYNLKKGLSNSVSAKALQEILSGNENNRAAGGAGGNVATGVALRGGKSVLIGKIANDNNGKFFTERAANNGVHYTPLLSANKDSVTTSVAALITPDKERSFAFLNGAGSELGPEDIDGNLIAKAKITYLDSYLWLSETGKAAVHHAAALAKESGSKVAIALNSANVVEQNQAAFLKLVKSHGNILVGDQQEFAALLGTKTFEETVEALHKIGCTASITAGAKGAYIVDSGKQHFIPSLKVTNIVDTNGAGDQFAAGFLYGLASGKSVVEAGHIGAKWASDVIQHAGAEPRIGKNAPVATPKKAPRP